MFFIKCPIAQRVYPMNVTRYAGNDTSPHRRGSDVPSAVTQMLNVRYVEKEW
jgi:hypothetical protein